MTSSPSPSSLSSSSPSSYSTPSAGAGAAPMSVIIPPPAKVVDEESTAAAASPMAMTGAGPAEWVLGRQECLIVTCLSVISLVVALDASIIVTSLPEIARALNGSALDAFWVGTSYLLTCTVFQPFIGSLSHIFGRRPLLMVSIVLFTAGSLIASLARNFTVLLAGRCIQGVGGGGILAMSMIIFTDIIPLRHRPKWYGAVQASWALGTILGPFIGGLLVERQTWRWVFYINFPFCGVGLVVVPLVVRLHTERTSFREKLLRVDWIGGAAFIAGMTSFLMAVSWGGIQFPWRSFRTLLPMVLGVGAVLASLFWERYGAREPFLRRSLFSNRSSVVTYLCSIAQGVLLFSQLYYLPLYFASVKGKSPSAAGLSLFPCSFTLTPSAVIVGRLITRLGRFRWAIWTGWTVTTLATGLLVLWDIDTSTPMWVGILICLGIGHALILTAQNFAVQAMAQIEDAGHAATMYAFMRTLGMALGVGIGSSVFQNLMLQKLDVENLSSELATNAEGFVDSLRTLPDSPIKQSILLAYLQGIRGVFIVLTALAGGAFLGSLLIKSYSLDQQLSSVHVLRKSSKSSDENRNDVGFKMEGGSTD